MGILVPYNLSLAQGHETSPSDNCCAAGVAKGQHHWDQTGKQIHAPGRNSHNLKKYLKSTTKRAKSGANALPKGVTCSFFFINRELLTFQAILRVVFWSLEFPDHKKGIV